MPRSRSTSSRGMVVFSGENGAGKTNLLEAISLLTPGRGLRRAPYGEVAREGSAGGFAVHAQLDGPQGDSSTSAPARPGCEPERRGGPPRAHQRRRRHRPTTCWNGCACSGSRRPWTRCSPGRPATAGASSTGWCWRSIPAMASRALDYEKAMRGRNRLLAEGSRDRAWFDAIETQMAEIRHGDRRRPRRDGAAARRHDRQAARPAPFPQADLALAGSLEAHGRPCAGRRDRGELPPGACRPAASATAPPAARSTARTAPTSWYATAPSRCRPSFARPASRRRCWSASCCRMPGCPARCRAACRSCCSTRSPRISTPAAAPRCSPSSTTSAARPS